MMIKKITWPMISFVLVAIAAMGGCARKMSGERAEGLVPQPGPGATTPGSGQKGSAGQGASQRPQGAFLAWKDFDGIDRTKFKMPLKQSVIAGVAGDPIFYRNLPSAVWAASASGAVPRTACDQERLEKGFKAEVKGDTISVTYNLNKICDPEVDAEDDLRKVRMIQCVGVDLATLKNKTERELSVILDKILYKGGLCANASEVREFFNYRRAVTLILESVTKPSSSYPSSSTAPLSSASPSMPKMERNVYTRAMMSPSGEPCMAKRKDGNWVYEGECWMRDMSEDFAGAGLAPAKLPQVFASFGSSKLKDVVVPIDSKDTWLKSGVAELEFPFWTGTLTFANGGAPRLVLKSSQGEAVDQLINSHSPLAGSSVNPQIGSGDDKTLDELEAEVAAAKAQLDSLKK